MGKFFNLKLKNMNHFGRGMEKMRQDFIKEQSSTPTAVVECPDKIEPMTPAQIRMAKARAGRKKNVAVANS